MAARQSQSSVAAALEDLLDPSLGNEIAHWPEAEALVEPRSRRQRAERWNSEAVRRAFRMYRALDDEQRAALRQLIEASDYATEKAGVSGRYQVIARLDTDDIVTAHASRKTHAWARFRALRERFRADLRDLSICEKTGEGTTRLLKRWKFNRGRTIVER